jgi:glycerophosphoryl diester phosphodiesterase
MLAHLPTPVIFAHRGSSAYAPENTLAAFELAVQHQADAIELDAKLCASGEVVVIHDASVDRTTNGRGVVNQLSLSALKELDAGSHFHPSFAGEKIPTLAEVFEAMGGRIFINVELTNLTSTRDRLPEAVAELVRKFGLEQQVLISSFNPIALRRIQPRLPGTPIGYLTLPGMGGPLSLVPSSLYVPYTALHPHLRDVTPRLVRRLQRRNKRLHIYTVNTAEEMRRLFSLGVEGIFTDDPPLARQVRQEVGLTKGEAA